MSFLVCLREPTKAIYRKFDQNNSLWWEFYLTEKLGYKTVDDLRNTMTNVEFLQWVIWYQRKEQERELARMQGAP